MIPVKCTEKLYAAHHAASLNSVRLKGCFQIRHTGESAGIDCQDLCVGDSRQIIAYGSQILLIHSHWVHHSIKIPLLRRRILTESVRLITAAGAVQNSSHKTYRIDDRHIAIFISGIHYQHPQIALGPGGVNLIGNGIQSQHIRHCPAQSTVKGPVDIINTI